MGSRSKAIGLGTAIGLALGAAGVLGLEFMIGIGNDYTWYRNYMPHETRNRIMIPLAGAALGAVVGFFRKRR